MDSAAKYRRARDKEGKRESDRNHHLTFWENDYKEFPRLVAEEMWRMERIYKRLKQYEHRMKAIDTSRRENAFYMGVPLHESDKKYSFEDAMKLVPELLRAAKEMSRKYGISIEDDVK